jgi:hypothetical protein
MHLTTGKTVLVNLNAELLGDAVDVIDVEMDEAVRSRVTFVLREVNVDGTSCDGNEPRKARLELMLPFLPEPEPLVPLDGSRRVRDVENRHDLLVHAAEITELPKNRASRAPAASSLGVVFDNLGDAEMQLEQVRAVEAPGVTHLKYRVVTCRASPSAANRA